ncbi:DUF6261 family protein [Parabacteroides provencensis]|uniref:DUF6261 family protein n=1 Tax=Parabacteroides provencensis TaxID=1944636 RepID=UPI000C15FECE|nr:DUF6261 family protein [Parabacteroides provencensis]
MEQTKAIGTVSRSRLSNAAHLGMNEEINQRLTPLSVADTKISEMQKTYADAIAREQDCVNRITKSASTEQLEKLDADRDLTFRFMVNIVEAYCICPTEQLQLAAKRLDAIFGAYHALNEKAFSEETAGIDGLLNDLGGDAAKADIELLKLENFVSLLSQQNQDYKDLDRTRTDEYTARVKVETSEARKATDEALDAIVRRVNAMQEMDPTDETAAFIDAVNQIYKKYSDLIAAKAGKNKKPDTPIV